MKFRFREKVYLFTLTLFLLFFNIGIFSLAYYSYQNNANAAKEICITEEKVIAESFENELKYYNYSRDTARIMAIYGDFYKEKGIEIQFAFNGETVYSSLDAGLVAPNMGYSATQRVDGKRYYLITEQIYEGIYTFTYAKDVSYLDEDFKSISIVFVITSLCASALLAICLFFILRKLLSPLEKLRQATEEISNGNFDCRADDSGSDEFSALASDFNKMGEHISEKIRQTQLDAEIKQRMLDNLAHEMRTPLTSIRGYAEYLRDANIDESEKFEALEFIITESERLKLIGERLLDEAFIRENGINAEKVNLGQLIFESRKGLSVKAANAGIELKISTDEIFAQCDRLLIQLLITNLTDNAIKACRGNGSVTIGTEITDGQIKLYVSDSGIGMTDEQLSHITEPFYRTDRSRSREGGGTGLGLSLCERIAKAHGTDLSFHSELGKGTTAYILLKII